VPSPVQEIDRAAGIVDCVKIVMPSKAAKEPVALLLNLISRANKMVQNNTKGVSILVENFFCDTTNTKRTFHP